MIKCIEIETEKEVCYVVASVDLVNVFKTFDGSKYVVDGINIGIDDSAFLVIVGASGCGKSTTLNIIAGLESVSSGDVFINGNNVNNVEPKDRNIAMVFQAHALYPHLNVYNNLAFALKVKRLSKKIIDEKVQNVADMLGLEDLLKRKPHQLSGGQKQRVAIGRAIIREPSVFLMDEPLSNLDANLKSVMRDELKRLHQKLKTTFIYVTHDQVEAMTLATQLAVMNEGKIQQVGTPYDVFMNPNNVFVAKFMSTYPLNLFKSTLVKVKDKFTVKFLNGILRGKIDSTKITNNDIYVGIRAEGFEKSNTAGSSVELKILNSEVLGSNTLFRCAGNSDFENDRIYVLLPTEEQNESIGEVFVVPKTHLIMLFDAESGRRIKLTENFIFEPSTYT